MDKDFLGILVLFGAVILTIIIGGIADSIATNYMRLKAIDRALTTMEVAIKAGVITKEEFAKEMNELASSLKKEKENE